MKTEFITLQLSLAEARGNWHRAVEAELNIHGEPLRWAITQIDEASQTATVEAVVTQTSQNKP